MTASYAPARLRRSGPLLLTAASLLAWGNGVVPGLPEHPLLRAGLNVAGGAALLAAARSTGFSWDELGLGRGTWRAGLRWGAAAFTLVGGAYVVLLATVPSVLRTGEAAEATGAEILLRAAVLIPLGTVLAEEVAFRGVLHAVAARRLLPWATVTVTAVTFGLWHVANSANRSQVGLLDAWRSPTVLTVVVVTTAGGLVMGWLRHRTGSLLAPVGLHLGTNVLGLLAAAYATGTAP